MKVFIHTLILNKIKKVNVTLLKYKEGYFHKNIKKEIFFYKLKIMLILFYYKYMREIYLYFKINGNITTPGDVLFFILNCL